VAGGCLVEATDIISVLGCSVTEGDTKTDEDSIPIIDVLTSGKADELECCSGMPAGPITMIIMKLSH
jgi:hypothetical protein